MRSYPFLALTLGVSLALSAGAAFAQESAQPQSVSEILQFQHALRNKLDAPSGEYSRFDEGQVARMKHAQDNVFRILSDVDSLDELSENQKIEVSNSLDQVKAILLANEGNRLICYREKKTGTNLLTKRCETYADREARAREAQQQMMDNNTRAQTEHGG
jgi:hypothetical protein